MGSEAKYKSTVISSMEFGGKLIDAGLIPHNTKRFIIDVDTGSFVKIYFECFAEKPTLDLVFEELLKDGGNAIHVKDAD